MNRYMPITGHNCNIPSLLIDTQATIDVLHDAAAYRIRAVTQLVENLAVSDEASKGALVQWCSGAVVQWCSGAAVTVAGVQHFAARWG
ncbi:hypothetical protein [Pseudomonas protegens]|uniref:hypothetical protein n=1 Tax=Pseudomonas protegens TaxID=380021 RepID=UPI0039794442